MTTLDYAAWLQRAIQSTRRVGQTQPNAEIEVSVAPPLDDVGLNTLSAKVSRRIPDALSMFLTQTTSSCACRWVCEPSPADYPIARIAFPDEGIRFPPWHCYGGACFFNGIEFWSSALTWRRMQEEYPKIAQKLSHCLVISAIDNGDVLALDLHADALDPPVIYLDHEMGDAYNLARDFDDFLLRWEQLCYLGPEGWMLYPFFDESQGQLDIDGAAAQALRDLFRHTIAA